MRDSARNVLVLDYDGFSRFRDGRGNSILADGNVFLLSKKKNADQARHDEYVEQYVMDLKDSSRVVSLARSIHERYPLAAVVNYKEKLVETAALVRETLGIPGQGIEEAFRYRNKLLMKEKVRAAGVRVPESCAAERRDEALHILRRHGQVVVKPVDGAGTSGAFPATDETTLLELIAPENGRGLEVEEFVSGPMFHIDSIVSGGRIVASLAFRYAFSNLDFPRNLCQASFLVREPSLRESLKAVNGRVIAALGPRDGVYHHEVFLTPGGEIVFCEIACRPGGLPIPFFVEEVFGVNLVHEHVRLQLGEGTSVSGEFPMPAEPLAWLALAKNRSGVVAGLEAPSLSFLRGFRWRVKEGDVVKAASFAHDDLCHAIATYEEEGAIREQLEALRASAAVQFVS